MQIPFLILMVVVVLGMFIWQRRRLSQSLAQNQDKNFGAVAERLGMRVEVGDANTSLLYFMEKRSNNYERTLRASGKPYAHVGSFSVMDGVKTNEWVVYRKITHSFGCYLELKLNQTIAPFEAILRHPNEYMIPNQDFGERAELQEASSGNVVVDGQFAIRTADPRIAPLLVPALQVIAQQSFVHIAGEGDRLWINFTRVALPFFATAAEEYLLFIETAACAIEGLPLPARLSVPALPSQAVAQ